MRGKSAKGILRLADMFLARVVRQGWSVRGMYNRQASIPMPSGLKTLSAGRSRDKKKTKKQKKKKKKAYETYKKGKKNMRVGSNDVI